MVLVGGKPIAFVDESGNTVDEIEVHQLLCGREIANGKFIIHVNIPMYIVIYAPASRKSISWRSY